VYLLEGAGLSSDTWNTGWIVDEEGSLSLYATVPILSITWYGPKYRKDSFWCARGASDDYTYGWSLR